jgi:serine protease
MRRHSRISRQRAGAAVLIQGMYQAASHTWLSPGQMRAILADKTTGTGQAAPTGKNTGVMPDLFKIGMTVLGVAPDVYLRDSAGDGGAVPSTGSLSTSLPVIVRPVPVANPAAAFGSGRGTENNETLGFQVKAGQDNYIYVRMRNRGGAAANGVRATVYWSPVATLVTPDQWHLIGTTGPVTVPRGNVLAAHECRFLVEPEEGLAAGVHTIAMRQFAEGIQVGGITWALQPPQDRE